MLTFTRLVPIIYVQDLDAEIAFYMAFGFRVLRQGDESPNFVALQEGDVQFGIEARGDFKADEAARSFQWQFQVNDLAEAVAICEAQGYRFRAPAKRRGTVDRWEMRIWSPNGHKINLEELASNSASNP